jgi:hypothetical protein
MNQEKQILDEQGFIPMQERLMVALSGRKLRMET